MADPQPDPVAEAERALALSLHDMVVTAGPYAGLRVLYERAMALARRYAALRALAAHDAVIDVLELEPSAEQMDALDSRREALKKEVADA